MRKSEIIFAIGLFIIGIILGRFIDWPYFVMAKDVNVGDLLSIGTSFILVYIVAKILEKGNEDRRVEKDMILLRLHELTQSNENIISKIRSGSIENTEAVRQFKLIHLKAKKLFKLISKININMPEQEKQNVFSSLRRLKDLATYSSRIVTINPPIQISNDIIYYSSDRISEIETEWDRLDDFLFEVQIKVNKG